jgi:hypothetical protein
LVTTAACSGEWGSSGPPPKRGGLLDLLLKHEAEFNELRDRCLQGDTQQTSLRVHDLCAALGALDARSYLGRVRHAYERVSISMYSKGAIGACVSIIWIPTEQIEEITDMAEASRRPSSRHHLEQLRGQWWMEIVE